MDRKDANPSLTDKCIWLFVGEKQRLVLVYVLSLLKLERRKEKQSGNDDEARVDAAMVAVVVVVVFVLDHLSWFCHPSDYA